MFCKNCGKQITDGSVFCPNCGADTEVNKYLYQPVSKQKYNTMSIIGLVVAGISLLLNFWGIVGIAATVISLIALLQIGKSCEKGKGMAIAGIAIGGFSIVFGVIQIILLASM